jgi:hypothetical protein
MTSMAGMLPYETDEREIRRRIGGALPPTSLTDASFLFLSVAVGGQRACVGLSLAAAWESRPMTRTGSSLLCYYTHCTHLPLDDTSSPELNLCR